MAGLQEIATSDASPNEKTNGDPGDSVSTYENVAELAMFIANDNGFREDIYIAVRREKRVYGTMVEDCLPGRRGAWEVIDVDSKDAGFPLSA